MACPGHTADPTDARASLWSLDSPSSALSITRPPTLFPSCFGSPRAERQHEGCGQEGPARLAMGTGTWEFQRNAPQPRHPPPSNLHIPWARTGLTTICSHRQREPGLGALVTNTARQPPSHPPGRLTGAPAQPRPRPSSNQSPSTQHPARLPPTCTGAVPDPPFTTWCLSLSPGHTCPQSPTQDGDRVRGGAGPTDSSPALSSGSGRPPPVAPDPPTAPIK